MVDLLIIGGGPAGLSAAIRAKEVGIKQILIVERSQILGGILNQCIHNGFGLHVFKEELTGPEYAHRLICKVNDLNIPYELNTIVTHLSKDKVAILQSRSGIKEVKAKAVILAMGCRERPRGAINIPGSRPAGIYSAGCAQELVNMKGYKIGNRAVIVGSGDIGLIMARRLTLEGTEVMAVVEKMPYSSGLRRNIVQCLDDFQIPLHYEHTVSRIFGHERLTGVNIARVDEEGQVLAKTQTYLPCDTLLFSVGLIPENELSMGAFVKMSPLTGGAVVDSNLESNVCGIFACGNVLHVHDLVDNVTLEAYEAAVNVKHYLDEAQTKKQLLPVGFDKKIRYIVPHFINVTSTLGDTSFKFRVTQIYHHAVVALYGDGEKMYQRKFRIITPGELEMITVKQAIMEKLQDCKDIMIKIEVGD